MKLSAKEPFKHVVKLARRTSLSRNVSDRRTLALLLTLALVLGSVVLATTANNRLAGSPAHAQDAPTPTSVQLQFPTATPTAGPPSPSPTRTATVSQIAPQIEAITADTNVRSGPDINESPLGKIQPGTQYTVIGQRFDWYQIEYPDSPSRTAWVYKDVVTLDGDANLIPQLELEDIPTVDPGFFAQQQTAESVLETPGGAATLTAVAQVTPTGIFTADPEGLVATRQPGEPLPTFTFAATVTPLTIPEAGPVNIVDESGVPPIIPILALGAVGLLGLLISVLRRL